MGDETEKKIIKFEGKASYDKIIKWLESRGFDHLNTGKTREMFSNPAFPELLFILATDRISIFDRVLDARIPMKGAVLTARTIDYLANTFSDIPNHLVAHGNGICKYLPSLMDDHVNITELQYLMKHMIVVKKTKVLKIEAIVRGNLTGSGYKDYIKNNGVVCGIQLPPGLVDGSEIPGGPIFTASTKADFGQHDENIPFNKVVEIVGQKNAEYIRDTALRVFSIAKDKAKADGIIIADTKFEFGIDENENILLIDEILTPDSSRFWPKDKWLKAMEEGKTPPSLDKQLVRDACIAAGAKSDPAWVPSSELITQTTNNYLEITELLGGKSLETFWSENMGIK